MRVAQGSHRPADLRNPVVALLCADFSQRTYLFSGEANSIDLFSES